MSTLFPPGLEDFPYETECPGYPIAPQDRSQLRTPGIEKRHRAPDVFVPGIIIFPDPVPACAKAVEKVPDLISVDVERVDTECARIFVPVFGPFHLTCIQMGTEPLRKADDLLPFIEDDPLAAMSGPFARAADLSHAPQSARSRGDLAPYALGFDSGHRDIFTIPTLFLPLHAI